MFQENKVSTNKTSIDRDNYTFSSEHKESEAVRYESDRGQELKDAGKEVHKLKNDAIQVPHTYTLFTTETRNIYFMLI